MMKSLLAMFLAFSVSGAFAQNKPMADAYKIDSEATKVEWIGKKVTGEHRGFVKIKEGHLQVMGEEILSGTIVVDMNSMTVTDLTDPEYVGKFLGHMKSPDFFNTEKYPETKLVIKNSKKTKKGLEVMGDLTILDKTRPVKFMASTPKIAGGVYSSKATITVDRTNFGLQYGSGKFFKGLADKMINDDFTLNIDLTAKK